MRAAIIGEWSTTGSEIRDQFGRDQIIDRAAGIVIVAGDIGEVPGIASICANIGVVVALQVEASQYIRFPRPDSCRSRMCSAPSWVTAYPADRAGGIYLGDVDDCGSTLIVIVAIAGEGPDGRAARNVGEGSAQIECAGALAADARAGATGPVSSCIVRATEAIDRTGRIGFADVDGSRKHLTDQLYSCCCRVKAQIEPCHQEQLVKEAPRSSVPAFSPPIPEQEPLAP